MEQKGNNGKTKHENLNQYNTFHVLISLTGCTNDIMTSDHSPVFASFEVGVASQFVSKQGTFTTVLTKN